MNHKFTYIPKNNYEPSHNESNSTSNNFVEQNDCKWLWNDVKTELYHNLKEFDYIFKQTVQKHANGVLKLLGIPYIINNIILSEITDLGPKIHRLDFVHSDIKASNDLVV